MLVYDKFKFCLIEISKKFLFLNVFDPQLVEIADVEPIDIEAIPFYIHPFIHRNLGYFCILDIVYNASMNTEAHIAF